MRQRIGRIRELRPMQRIGHIYELKLRGRMAVRIRLRVKLVRTGKTGEEY